MRFPGFLKFEMTQNKTAKGECMQLKIEVTKLGKRKHQMNCSVHVDLEIQLQLFLVEKTNK